MVRQDADDAAANQRGTHDEVAAPPKTRAYHPPPDQKNYLPSFSIESREGLDGQVPWECVFTINKAGCAILQHAHVGSP